MKFPILIHKDKDSDYGVTVPGLPGCFSAGSSYEEALEMSREAILCHIEGMMADGDSIPAQPDLASLMRKRRSNGGVWAIVEVDLRQIGGKACRVNITLPENLLHTIDQYASTHHLNRSNLLAQAAMDYISRN